MPVTWHVWPQLRPCDGVEAAFGRIEIYYARGTIQRVLASATSTTPVVTRAPDYSRPDRSCKPSVAAIGAVDPGKRAVVSNCPVAGHYPSLPQVPHYRACRACCLGTSHLRLIQFFRH